MSRAKTTWDAELYEARHSFVWEYGEGVIDLLDPQPGEHILDLGCGPGHLTKKIADHGAQILGLDASPEMIGQARQNYPQLQFILQDAASMNFNGEFDAVFSNAALHWMLDASRVAKTIGQALRTGGRLVAELGGKGNVRQIETAVEKAAAKYYAHEVIPKARTFYPSVGEYSALLESQGLETRMAQLFDRPTPLEGEKGMENWLRQFKWFYFEGLESGNKERALAEVVEELRPALFRDGSWYADYRRLRITAIKA